MIAIRGLFKSKLQRDAQDENGRPYGDIAGDNLFDFSALALLPVHRREGIQNVTA